MKNIESIQKLSKEEHRLKYRLPVVGKIYKCNKCGKEILVERGLIGTDHTMIIVITCLDCLDEETKKKAIKEYEKKMKNEKTIQKLIDVINKDIEDHCSNTTLPVSDIHMTRLYALREGMQNIQKLLIEERIKKLSKKKIGKYHTEENRIRMKELQKLHGKLK